MNILSNTVYWAVFISLSSYYLGQYLQNKLRIVIFNPLFFSTICTVVFLILTNISYEDYYNKSDFIHYLLTPATVCLAIPLYEQITQLKNNYAAILIGISSGVAACLLSILLFAVIFNWEHDMFVTVLPKSITAAMAMGVSEELGGMPNLTVPIVIMTGITGNIIAESVCKLFRIKEPIAKGIAIGTSSHAMGTAKAAEMGEIEGAMSGLSIAVSGILTVIFASIFSHFY